MTVPSLPELMSIPLPAPLQLAQIGIDLVRLVQMFQGSIDAVPLLLDFRQSGEVLCDDACAVGVLGIFHPHALAQADGSLVVCDRRVGSALVSRPSGESFQLGCVHESRT